MNDEIGVLVGFVAWPTESGWEPSAFDLFRQFPRVEMEMTESEFAAFTASLERQGITLREVERRRQMGWVGPYGTIPGGLDVDPAPGWRRLYEPDPSGRKENDD